MAMADTAGNKRKRPPTFAHLPEKSAKKAKREWVERQKIKSQWRATRRKEGLPTARTARPRRAEDPQDDDDATDAAEDGAGSASASADEGEGDFTPPRPPPSNTAKESEPQDRPDLRELRRQAYSSATLHTHKADPLGRRRGSAPPGRGGRGGTPTSRGRGSTSATASRERGSVHAPCGRERGRGREGHGHASGSGRPQDQGYTRGSRAGRGQPNMRLRMNVMLEQIKRDLA